MRGGVRLGVFCTFAVKKRTYHQVVITVLALVALFSSCEGCGNRWGFLATNSEEKAQVRHTLNLADSLMEENPGTAYSLLKQDSALIQKAGKAKRMRYALLKTNAEDKLFIPHKSDSLMREVVDYYEKHGSEREQVQAYYLLGRVCLELSNTSSATSAFLQALDVKVENDSVAYSIQSKTATWVANVYEMDNMHEHSLRYNKKAFEYARLANNINMEAYTLALIGRSFCYLKRANEAIDYYLRAIEFTELLRDPVLYNKIQLELSAVYVDAGMAENARQSLSSLKGDSTFVENLPFYYNWSIYYRCIGDLDSTIIFLKKYLTESPLSNKWGILLEIANVYKELGNKEKALEYQELSLQYSDSLKRQELIEAQDNAKNVAEKIAAQKSNKATSQKLNYNYGLIAVLVAVFLSAIYFVIHHTRRKAKAIEANLHREKNYWLNLRERDKAKIKEANDQVKQLEKTLTATTKEKVVAMQTDFALPQFEEEGMSHTKEQAQLVKNFTNSSIYKMFHSSSFNPTGIDYAELEEMLNKTFNNFTYRLRLLYPDIDKQELHLCCLLKSGITLKDITFLLDIKSSTLTMSRKKLLKKIFQKEGKAVDFDKAIKQF